MVIFHTEIFGGHIVDSTLLAVGFPYFRMWGAIFGKTKIEICTLI